MIVAAAMGVDLAIVFADRAIGSAIAFGMCLVGIWVGLGMNRNWRAGPESQERLRNGGFRSWHGTLFIIMGAVGALVSIVAFLTAL